MELKQFAGRVITGYQINGTWHEIGKGNPQWPQVRCQSAPSHIDVPGEHNACGILISTCECDRKFEVYTELVDQGVSRQFGGFELRVKQSFCHLALWL